MPKIDQTNVNFSLFEDSNEFLGMGSVDLPDITWLTQTVSGAGIAGNIETIVQGHMDTMTLGIKFRTFTKEAMRLTEPRRHNLELRVARQDEDPVSGNMEVTPVKHVFIVEPKSYKGGSVAMASPADASGEYAVRYWKSYIDGKVVLEIDPFNYICKVNGTDFLAKVRKALGK